MRSLTTKLILAFLLISLVQAGLVAFLARWATEREFDQFIQEQAFEAFVDDAAAYYRARGSWDGVVLAFGRRATGLGRPGRPGRMRPGPPGPGPRRGVQPLPFVLADRAGDVVVPAGRYRMGEPVEAPALAAGTPVTVDGEVVGTALRTAESRQLGPRELRYLERTLRVILYAAAGGLLIAFVLGALLARRYTRPLRQLTTAARALARGELGRQVRVRSRDELGTLTAAFNQMSADLEAATAQRRQMTADVAHDLRTPLTVLTGYLEALRDGDLPPTPERFETMYAEAQQLGRLVDDLRMLSLADAGELPLQRLDVAPEALLARLQRAFAQQAARQQVDLRVEAEAGLPALRVDPDRMVQVLANLVGNALRHTPAGGHITLAAGTEGGQVALQVRDTGSGISPEALPHVFDRFYRADPSRRQPQGESGLGLAIARSLVELHGGTIAVASEPGAGTVFTIVLPVSSGQQVI